MYFITVRNEVAKVIFLHLSVILFTGGGGGLPQCMLGYHTPPEQTPPPEQALPPRAGTPSPGRRLLLRTVRILLECILVYFMFCRPVNIIAGGEVDEGTEPGTSRRKRRSIRQRVYRQADLNSKGSNINSSYINILNVSNLCDP